MDKKQTESGSKAYQRQDTEYRAQAYLDWHRTLDRHLLMSDIDAIEWRVQHGEPVAVGVIEVTRVDNGKEVHAGYLKAIIQRFEQRDFQARTARRVAKSLSCKAYIVLFRQDCSEFWIYNLSDGGSWSYRDAKGMEDFLKNLKPDSTSE